MKEQHGPRWAGRDRRHNLPRELQTIIEQVETLGPNPDVRACNAILAQVGDIYDDVSTHMKKYTKTHPNDLPTFMSQLSSAGEPTMHVVARDTGRKLRSLRTVRADQAGQLRKRGSIV